ncbi:hypothetical protein DL96DRAFT_1610074 [Flagelloscypha sp. PMI_526]|nr:hypothetical protein DL96DRAFT_1610074 [Flagelloscypha sp. PMI_526]
MTSLTLDKAVIDSTFGALFAGFAVSCLLFGIVCMQVYSYFQRFSSDPLFTKSMVGGIWILELLDQIFIGHCSYHYVVSYVHPAQQTVGVRSSPLEFGSVSLVNIFLRSSLNSRKWKVSNRNWWLTGLIVICGMLYTKQAFEQKALLSGLEALKVLLLRHSQWLPACASDILIAASLAWYLRRLKTGYQESDSLVNGLIMYGLSTGFISGTLSLLVLILYNARKNTFEFMTFYFALSKILDISLMSSLSSRKLPGHHSTRPSQSNYPRRFSTSEATLGSKQHTLPSAMPMASFKLESQDGTLAAATDSRASVSNTEYTSAYVPSMTSTVPLPSATGRRSLVPERFGA